MKYDFTSIMDRHGKDAIAVDGLGTGFAPAAPKEGFDAIPMWVADMNFPTVPTIQEAIIERTNHPAFGYFNPTDEYFDSIIRWQAKRNGVQGLTKECIGYENGVLGGVISALNCVCSKGDKILIHSPTRNNNISGQLSCWVICHYGKCSGSVRSCWALTHTSPQPAGRSHSVLLHQIIPIRFLTFFYLRPKSRKQVFTKNKKALCPVLTESTKCPYSSRSLECDLPLFSCFLSASSL